MQDVYKHYCREWISIKKAYKQTDSWGRVENGNYQLNSTQLSTQHSRVFTVSTELTTFFLPLFAEEKAARDRLTTL